MIKTLNDILSLAVLLILAFLCIRLFIGSIFKNNNETATHLSRKEFLADYLNNEDE